MLNRNVFIFILIIFLYLTKQTKQDDERIFSTLRTLFQNSIESDIQRNSFSFNYLKYKIRFSHFHIKNFLEENINIKEIEKNIIYSVNDIRLFFTYKNYVIIDDDNDNISLEEANKEIEIKFKEIIFQKEDNFLIFNQSNVDSIKVPKVNKISHLKYFKDYNEGNIRPIFSETNEYCDIDDILKILFNDMLKERISYTLENKMNLYYYDFKEIMSMSKNISYAQTKYKDSVDYLYIDEYNLSLNDVEIKNDNLYIYNIILKGYFVLLDGNVIEIKAYLKENKNMRLNIYGIDFSERRLPFEIKLENKEVEEDEKIYEQAFNNHYIYYIDEQAILYFDSLIENF